MAVDIMDFIIDRPEMTYLCTFKGVSDLQKKVRSCHIRGTGSSLVWICLGTGIDSH